MYTNMIMIVNAKAMTLIRLYLFNKFFVTCQICSHYLVEIFEFSFTDYQRKCTCKGADFPLLAPNAYTFDPFSGGGV